MPLPSVTDRCPALDRTILGSEGRVWQARGAEGAAAVAVVEAATGEPDYVKRRERRAAWIARGGGLEVFVKRARLADFGAVLRATLRAGGSWIAYKGALHEAERTLAVEGRVPRVARLYAIGEQRRRGWVVEETLVFEALVEHETLADRVAARRHDPAERADALRRAIAVLLDYDRAGLAHLDLNSRNVMLHRADPGQDCAVDIEQVVEIAAPRSDLLAHAFGHLYTRGIEEHVARPEYQAIALPSLARALGVEEVPSDVLLAYRWFLGRSLKRRQRLRLARQGLDRMRWMRRSIERRAARAARPRPSDLSVAG